MSTISLAGITHRYRGSPVPALSECNQVFQDGGAYALLGPSGCGKTTLLNLISGLLAPTAGDVLFDGRSVRDFGPAARHVAQVFQFPVVYASMTVRDNLAFPLRNAGVPAGAQNTRVQEIADALELTPLLSQRARGLSPADKQKVSMGRGLVRQDVSVVLLDEPLTVVDTHARWRLRRKLRQIHRRFGRTMIYVTHDQLEAATFADEIAVMDAGRIVQFASPRELFETPAHTFVGTFIGSPGMNVLPARNADGAVCIGETRFAHLTCTLPGPFEVGIRPEFVEIGTSATGETVPARVADVENHGLHRIVTASFDAAAPPIRARIDDDWQPAADAQIHLRLPTQHVHFYVNGTRVERP